MAVSRSLSSEVPSNTPPSLAWPTQIALSKLLDEYCLGDKLGEGICGLVYSARRERQAPAPPEHSAIKVGSVTDIKDELEILKYISDKTHSNIVHIWNSLFDRDWGALVMARADADLARFKPDQPSVVRSVMWQICRGVDYLHMRGVVHLDIKSQNILVFSGDGDPHVRVADFSHAMQERAWQILPEMPRNCRGTLAYRSPESLLRVTTAAAPLDMWSIGCIALELAAGNHPFLKKKLGYCEYAILDGGGQG